mmetsp:Transcript_82100/g.123268  ORF Transcript_82100/g.123268 Transcript_82100/m.123268 type:complete len:365 (+) Transcript_82100:91-1185(+)|eukprot:CAMPEP_0177690116 /NCGR_PEP_ID=MMETSP0484_2-20121128/580_1 /TAXON_ID=354590 /ORGANISM="Rhodomonas lens, Strain RHODO" /LENGTH=364 /DNA_ID=CAMNT_0019200609 /DNA_START=91 /DNA_END=1185 /DNA_ORIENTATION=+
MVTTSSRSQTRQTSKATDYLSRANVAWSFVLWIVLQVNQALQAAVQVLLLPVKAVSPATAILFRNHLLRFGWTPAFLSLRYSSRIRIVVTGDSVPEGELLGFMANHQSYADSFVISYFLRCIGRANGGMLWIIWKSFILFPLGWASKMSEHVFVGYGKEKDLQATAEGCQGLLKRGFHSVVFFPEGAVKRPSTQLKAQEYALAQGLPHYQHVLCPKTGAFALITHALRLQGCKEYVDITIGFPDASFTGRIFNNLPLDIWGIMARAPEPQDVHLHLQRIPLSELGETEAEQTRWLFQHFATKDKLLHEFRQTGRFAGVSEVFVPRTRAMLLDAAAWLSLLASLYTFLSLFWTPLWRLHSSVLLL